eukprot:TRINITY_DN1069_c0_g1_i1.p1 TRINITY_DN1069_c0_g1~~TRINITY_DN1069_c0_g1_i1.p1  ORF type:complete len:293 (+),score=12.01 TRINITY_DN1069_c0_g1_i1:52-879(+)
MTDYSSGTWRYTGAGGDRYGSAEASRFDPGMGAPADSRGYGSGDRYSAPSDRRGAPVSAGPAAGGPPGKRRREYAGWRETEPLQASDVGLYPTSLGPSFGGGVPMGAGGGPRTLDDSMLAPTRIVDLGGGRHVLPLNGGVSVGVDPVDARGMDLLPADATSTLFIDGLPEDCTRREACHIFRPFIGFKEVRLVHKEGRRGDKITLCFVEFADPRCAATALEALQGYRFDENDRESPTLRLTFARNPGPGGGYRGGREPSSRDEYRGGGGSSRSRR